jgi:hypothetical protein
MNGEQKRAWFTVVVAALACMAYLVLGLAVNFQVAFAGLALFGLVGLTGFKRRREKWDERDLAINRRATLVGFTASYLAFFVCCFGTWIVVYAIEGEGQVSVHVVAQFTIVGMIVAFTIRSLAILVLYGRPMEAEHA